MDFQNRRVEISCVKDISGWQDCSLQSSANNSSLKTMRGEQIREFGGNEKL